MQRHGNAQVIGQLFATSAEGHVLQADKLDPEPFASTAR
jgi:hypothetical protein